MSSLPVLIDADPATTATPPNPSVFPRERQAAFLAALAATGSVRSASATAGVSHQTAYRARLASPGFRQAWDAALLAARAQAEEVLASKALEGWDEEVVYHGEVVCTRRRFSDRLLLAHLARLDKLCGDTEVAQFADAFDATLARYAAGEDRPARPPEFDPSTGSGPSAGSGWSGVGGEGEGTFSSSGQWSMRSTGADGMLTIPPPLPVKRERGTVLKEAQQLEIGDYEVWWDEERAEMLTNWPAPAQFMGEELAVHTDDGDVIGPWPLDPEKHGGGRCFWARTLTPEEEAGLLAADERASEHRAARLALYHRAAFGLASAAECASLSAANGGDEHWADPAQLQAG